MKFIELNVDTAVNIDTISRIERLQSSALVYIGGGESVVADIPYDVLLDILNDNASRDEAQVASQIEEAAKTNASLQVLLKGSQFTRI